MRYLHIVVLKSSMLHAKTLKLVHWSLRGFLKEFTIYGKSSWSLTLIFIYTLVTPSYTRVIKKLALTGQADLEGKRFEYYGHIHPCILPQGLCR